MENNLECFCCGVCCVKFQASLKDEEAEHIAAFLGLGAGEFVRRFTDPRWLGKQQLLLHENGRCVFLAYDPAAKINHCRIYPVRPHVCVAWKAGLQKSECREGLSRLWRLAVDDSGRLQGNEEDIREFNLFLQSLESDLSAGKDLQGLGNV